MKKWENKKHSSLPKSITKRTMFLKMQNSLAFESLRISTAGNKKKCKQNFIENLDFLAFFRVNWIVDITFEVRLW